MLQLRDIMTTDLVTVTPRTTLRDTVALLASRHLSGAPVVDGATVVGVVSASDILAFETSASRVREEEASAPSDDWAALPGWEGGEAPPPHFFRDEVRPMEDETTARPAPAAGGRDPLAEHTVGEVMTRRLYALRPTLDAGAAADRMRSAGVHRVLVMEGGRLLGLVSAMDLVRAVADHRIVGRRFVFDVPRGTGEEPEEIREGEDAPPL